MTLEPGLEGPPRGCPGHSPLNPEALNTGGGDLSHMTVSSQWRLEEERCDEQDAFAQKRAGGLNVALRAAAGPPGVP